MKTDARKTIWIYAGALTAAFALSAQPAMARTETYEPGIWVDPDGCQHWVMDDGFEGYMTPNVTPDGKPVCGNVQVCHEVSSDQLFATGSAAIGASGKRRLMDFFSTYNAKSFTIVGHTDSRASDAYNMDLSMRRARAVASIAKQAGANVSEIKGYGERKPVASNETSAGMAKNRRVEIMCVQ